MSVGVVVESHWSQSGWVQQVDSPSVFGRESMFKFGAARSVEILRSILDGEGGMLMVHWRGGCDISKPSS